MPDNLELKKSIYQALREGDFPVAEELTLQGLEEDIHNQDYEKILKSIKFWRNRHDLFDFKENSGEKLFEEWDKFVDFSKENRLDNKKAFLSIKDYVFRKIVDLLIDSYRLSPVPERDTLILLGQSFYEIGLLDKAIETLEYAMSIVLDDEDVRIYSMLGNLYSESGENDLAMVMYSEAFLKFPQLIDLGSINFPAIRKIEQMVAEDEFHENEILEWIPVYGYLYEGLTTRRKIEYKDYMELKEKIIDYEKTLRVDKKVIRIIIPRLINYYLWVLDYYLYQVNTGGPANNVVKRILDLIRTMPINDKIKEKLLSRSEALFKRLLASRPEEKESSVTEEVF